MPPMCPTVVLGLPGTAGSVKTRQQDLYLRCCELCGTSGNRVTTQDGACYGRCAVSARSRIGFAPEPAVAKLRGTWPMLASFALTSDTGWLEVSTAKAIRTSQSLPEARGSSVPNSNATQFVRYL